MVYIDPPYGIKFGSNWQVSARKRDVKDGKLEDAAREAEQIKAFRDTWELGIHSYLSYLRDRLLVARDLLTEIGLVLRPDRRRERPPRPSLMDEVFGSENFVSQIIVRKTTARQSRGRRPGDVVRLSCSGTREDIGQVEVPPALSSRKRIGDDAAELHAASSCQTATRRPTHRARSRSRDLCRRRECFALDNLTSQTRRRRRRQSSQFEFDGTTFTPGSRRDWKTNRDGHATTRMRGPARSPRRSTLRYVRYLDDFPACPLTNLWDDTATAGFGDRRSTSFRPTRRSSSGAC